MQTSVAVVGARPDEAVASAFIALDNRYARHMHRVYFRDPRTGSVSVVQGAEPHSFVLTEFDSWQRTDAKDAHQSYFAGVVVVVE